MLLGKACASEYTFQTQDLKVAKSRLRKAFAFVGLTEFWNLSICLFHAEFGGEVSPASFQNVRPSSRYDAFEERAKPSIMDGMNPRSVTTDGLTRAHEHHDISVYREAVASFAMKVCTYGLKMPEPLRELAQSLPWKVPLPSKCFED